MVVTAVDAAGARVCAFVVCDTGLAEIDCPSGASEATSPEGVIGCCRDGGLTLPKGDLCPDAAAVAVSVQISVEDPGAAGGACLGYELSVVQPAE